MKQNETMFPELNKSLVKMDDQLFILDKRLNQVRNRRNDTFDHARSLERRKILNKEAYELLQTNTK